jgi:hypothetical protein
LDFGGLEVEWLNHDQQHRHRGALAPHEPDNSNRDCRVDADIGRRNYQDLLIWR